MGKGSSRCRGRGSTCPAGRPVAWSSSIGVPGSKLHTQVCGVQHSGEDPATSVFMTLVVRRGGASAGIAGFIKWTFILDGNSGELQ